MKLLTTDTLVFEENKTRAQLYELWLDQYDVAVAPTKRQADEKLDGRVAVAVLNEEFADGEATTLLKIVRKRAPICRVVATRERSAVYPDLDIDHHLLKPVFRDELVEKVTTLIYRANYHLALRLYYKTTVTISHIEMQATENEAYDRLQQRITRLQTLIAALREELTRDDIIDVKRAISFEKDANGNAEQETTSSRYRPDSCSHCGEDWTTTADGDRPATQLGAYVWRCKNCGHTQMRTDPSHQNETRYRR